MPALLVTELDGLADQHDVIVESLGTGRPLLFVGRWRSLTYVGPLWFPGRGGCPQCLVTRTANSPFGPDLSFGKLVEASARDEDLWVLGPGVLRMIEFYVRRLLTGKVSYDDHVIVIDGVAGTVEPQVLLPDSTCETCSTPDAQTPPLFTDEHTALTKPDPTRLRTAELSVGVVERDYLFAGLGLFKEIKQDLQSPFGASSVELSTQWGRREPAIGRASTYRRSRTVAVLEGLERYAGLHCGGRTVAVRAPYRAVTDQALYPPLLGTHPEESYRAEGFRYRMFDPDVEVDWVWGYSFQRQDRILVPERSAFWGPRHDGEICFTYDTSNGCAVGNSVEEALLHGLREVAERDAFLLTWYRQLSLPEIDLDEVGPPLAGLLRKSRLFTGFDFRCFLATMEYGMPACYLVAANRTADRPALFTGCGAHPDPSQAIHGAMLELVGTILATRHSYQRRRPEALKLLDDPLPLRRMEDHSLVGALPEAASRHAFLLADPPERIPLAAVRGTLRTDSTDLRADVSTALSGMLRAGLDVIVVDQTMPELRRNGLHCVRVLVPGLVPMTFGHLNRRIRNLPRLTEGVGIPYRSQLKDGAELGCIPHPFP